MRPRKAGQNGKGGRKGGGEGGKQARGGGCRVGITQRAYIFPASFTKKCSRITVTMKAAQPMSSCIGWIVKPVGSRSFTGWRGPTWATRRWEARILNWWKCATVGEGKGRRSERSCEAEERGVRWGKGG